MIGVFDSGHGGLTVLKELCKQFPQQSFLYLGDHANAPYGNRSNSDVVELTRRGVETLFSEGCKLVLLGCNTATSIACRTLQQDWLPNSEWQECNILGIIAPTVEVATQTPWGITEPQYPQKYKTDIIALFATQRTIDSAVFDEEIKKRCPKMKVICQACPQLAGMIEDGATQNELDGLIASYVGSMMEQSGTSAPHFAILGCTHYPLVEDIFAKHLPGNTRLLSQPSIVADSLEHYLARHTDYIEAFANDDGVQAPSQVKLLTTGNLEIVEARQFMSWPDRPAFVAYVDEGL